MSVLTEACAQHVGQHGAVAAECCSHSVSSLVLQDVCVPRPPTPPVGPVAASQKSTGGEWVRHRFVRAS